MSEPKFTTEIKIKQLDQLRKGIIESIDIASKQNKAIQQIVDDQYKLLKNLTLQVKMVQKLLESEREYLKQNQ